MIRPDVVLAIARAESRLTRRLVRYWVFLVLAWGVGILGYVNYAFILHAPFSAYSATVAAISKLPRLRARTRLASLVCFNP